MSIENDVRVYLVAQLTGEPAIFVMGLPSLPDDAIGILVTGGPEPVLAMGPAVVAQEITIDVFVRGARGRDRAIEALMQDVHAELQAVSRASMNGTVYDLVSASAEPSLMDRDRQGRPRWMASYVLLRVEGP